MFLLSPGKNHNGRTQGDCLMRISIIDRITDMSPASIFVFGDCSSSVGDSTRGIIVIAAYYENTLISFSRCIIHKAEKIHYHHDNLPNLSKYLISPKSFIIHTHHCLKMGSHLLKPMCQFHNQVFRSSNLHPGLRGNLRWQMVSFCNLQAHSPHVGSLLRLLFVCWSHQNLNRFSKSRLDVCYNLRIAIFKGVIQFGMAIVPAIGIVIVPVKTKHHAECECITSYVVTARVLEIQFPNIF